MWGGRATRSSEARARAEARGAPRSPGALGEWPRRAHHGRAGGAGESLVGAPGVRGPGPGARSPHSPEISAWGTSLRLKPLAPYIWRTSLQLRLLLAGSPRAQAASAAAAHSSHQPPAPSSMAGRRRPPQPAAPLLDPAGPAQPRPAKGRAKVPARGSRSTGGGSRRGGDNKSRRPRRRARWARGPAAQSGGPKRSRRASSPGPAPRRRGGSAGEGRAGRGGARPGPTGRSSPPRGLGDRWIPRICPLPEGGGGSGGVRRPRLGSPRAGPPRPAPGAEAPPVGAGRGGGAEAGLPPPDVTSRLPRTYQGPPLPPPKSASLQSSPPGLRPCGPAPWQRAPRSAPAAFSPLCPLPPVLPAPPYQLLAPHALLSRLPLGSISHLMFLWGMVRGCTPETRQETRPHPSQPYGDAMRRLACLWSPPRDSWAAEEQK